MLHRIGFVSFVALIVGGASGAAESSWRIEPTSHLVRAGTGDIGRIAFFRSADGGDSGAVC